MKLDRILKSMLKARSLSLEISRVFCMSSRRDWVLRRSRRKVPFSRSNWLTLVVKCAGRSFCRSNWLERSFNCSSRRSSSSASRRRAADSRCSTESVMEPTVEVKGGVLIVLTSIASDRTRGRHGGTQLRILNETSFNNQLSYRFIWSPKRWKANKEWTATAVEWRVNHYGIRWRYNANNMVRSWVQNIHGVTRSHIHKLTISGESSGSGIRPETKKCLKLFIKIQKRKAAGFLRVSVGRKTL